MLNFNRKRKTKEIFYSKITLGILSIVFLFFANSTWNAYRKSSFASSNKKISENSLKKMNERKSTLTNEIDKLKTQRGVEEDIREKFGFIKKGEEVVSIVDSNNENNNNENNSSGGSSWWMKIIEFF